MRYNKIRKMDISDGEGIRVSLFVQGCEFHCKGCFNPNTWDFSGGKEFTTETLDILMNLCNNERIKGLSILGGEPMHDNNIDGVFNIVSTFKEKYPNKDIWIWSGFLFETLIKKDKQRAVLEKIDYLVDGQFQLEKRNLNLKWAGSENQRWIDVKKSLKQGQIVLAGNMLEK